MAPADASKRIPGVIIAPHASIKEAIAGLERAGTGALLLCDEDRTLRGLLTDGDVRRAILRGLPLDKPCIEIATLSPVIARERVGPVEALRIMDHSRGFVLNQLPLVSEDGRATGLLLRSDIVAEEELPFSAIVMAGGQGLRLRPLTEDLPKPMLPVGGRPLLERTIGRLRDSGIHRVYITTSYLPDTITSYFGDGQAFGVELDYVNEDQPLGTAGAIGLIEELNEPLLVINGDILTTVDFRNMLAYHKKHRPDVTVGVRRYDLQIPYGVLECDGPVVTSFQEKPTVSVLVNAGVYLLEPSVAHFVPKDRRLDMPELIQRLLDAGRPVVSFPIVEYWMDIGRHEDYARVQEDMRSGRI
jgi:dTDP-glucose pyrophosphorylase/CBS domain-containing protein